MTELEAKREHARRVHETTLRLNRDKEQLTAVTQAKAFLDAHRLAGERLGKSRFKSSRFGDLRLKFG